jgi:hypothetical protein
LFTLVFYARDAQRVAQFVRVYARAHGNVREPADATYAYITARVTRRFVARMRDCGEEAGASCRRACALM